jgi:hypothetical protein
VGYLIQAGDGSVPNTTVSVTDEAWKDLIRHAAEGGYSAPHLWELKRSDGPILISGAEAKRLHDALSNALGTSLTGVPTIDPNSERLDRDTVHRVRYVLDHSDIHLERTPYWR